MSEKSDLSSEKIFNQGTIAFPFAQKLWGVINNKDQHFMQFSIDGSTILIKKEEMEEYLKSSQYTLGTNNFIVFSILLYMHGFIMVAPEKEGYLAFRHEYFTQDGFRDFPLIFDCIPKQDKKMHVHNPTQINEEIEKDTENMESPKEINEEIEKDTENMESPKEINSSNSDNCIEKDVTENNSPADNSEKLTDNGLELTTETCKSSAEETLEDSFTPFFGFYGNRDKKYLNVFFEGLGDDFGFKRLNIPQTMIKNRKGKKMNGPRKQKPVNKRTKKNPKIDEAKHIKKYGNPFAVLNKMKNKWHTDNPSTITKQIENEEDIDDPPLIIDEMENEEDIDDPPLIIEEMEKKRDVDEPSTINEEMKNVESKKLI